MDIVHNVAMLHDGAKTGVIMHFYGARSFRSWDSFVPSGAGGSLVQE